MKGLSRLITVVVALVLAALVLWPRQIEAQLNRISGTQIVGGTAKPTTVQTGNGLATAPSWGFSTAPLNFGLYRSGNNALTLTTATATKTFSWDGDSSVSRVSNFVTLGWSSSTDATATSDTSIARAAAGAVNISQTATTTAELQVSGGNGGFISSVKALTELTTIAAAATTATAIQIPATAVVLGVSVRVVTVIPTAATFTVTSATPAKTWNTAAVTVAANSTDPGTAPGPTFQTTASAITITPNLTPGAATGQVRVTIYYYTITPATS